MLNQPFQFEAQLSVANPIQSRFLPATFNFQKGTQLIFDTQHLKSSVSMMRSDSTPMLMIMIYILYIYILYIYSTCTAQSWGTRTTKTGWATGVASEQHPWRRGEARDVETETKRHLASGNLMELVWCLKLFCQLDYKVRVFSATSSTIHQNKSV